ncbi:MAG: Wzt carbohydrate-binding domain-containing protein [Microcoleus sp. PH2017_01_SCD_O_A]|uniref:Wzt carbohydrate-binding domain-containing protein n=1 Tax=Microcoleus sp. PH2017_01_SCD_O_A TaxID=2798812 RepID=UPI001DD9E321|nr:Wzt carbohydrate-binding domain-containing protein [Microcoleus sp. PH2017_01_SCD_O_A]MCC3425194.1 Wzt carbohydrate-binding domain-containing protein [Microcoleus sp. PH2017_01_SCD_O_A]MCC3431188.1 Wzt carbohydrate-binding domain-containing protein [Microcoleus sp. PH2017_04_SCI_O_A]TAG68142.1 MAG: ATP-binding cassette domain-containing protein [Oscillatoriales cyanobacterium]TAH17064.1 MAG: ATP-binding cassette domain-containing protein [Oscillatoriales cyanobacterium]
MRQAIVIKGLGKRFNSYSADRPFTIMEAALWGWWRMKPQAHFWALRDVSFSVSPGEMLGILGKNGAGKSTLLQLIGGIGRAEEGSIKVNGKIGGLLDLGAGFHSDLTGRENVFVGAVVAGLTHREATRRFSDIVEFAELEQFIDSPLRTYSTGMQMRLAFSVAVHTDPEVLLIDEHLSVGDVAFQTKCLNKIAEFKTKGCAIVLISHNAGQIQKLCDRALWLRDGKIQAYGEPEVVAGQYLSEMRSETEKRTPMRPPEVTSTGSELRVNENRFGSLEVEITDVKVLPDEEIDSGDTITIEIHYTVPKSIDAAIFGVTISREDGQSCFETNTNQMGRLIPLAKGKGKIRLHVDRLDLGNGQYYVNPGVYEKSWAYAYDYHWHVYPLYVRSTVHQKTILCPPYRWEFDGKMEVLDLPETTDKVHALNKNNPSYAKISTQLKNKQSPDFLILGAQKCSTEALYGYLENHLQNIKEGAKQVHFFELNFERGVEWYSKQLTRSVAGDKVLLWEMTPYYIYHPLVAERVYKCFPDVKLIVMLRNPVQRAWMHYHLEVAIGCEKLEFEKAIASEPDRLKGEIEKFKADEGYYSFNHQHYSYLSRGIYVEQIKNWLDYFPREQLLIIKSEDFQKNPGDVFSEVLEFLDVKASAVKEYQGNSAEDYSNMPPEIEQELTNYFKPYNQELSDLLKEDFSWS